MVVTIEKASGSCMSALRYNERKVSKGLAEIVAYANLDSLEKDAVRSSFEAYENWSKRSSRLCFHASVNPSGQDTCSEDQVLAFIRDMMEDLGYQDQPYLVYRHHDIDRQHYHVVSVRSDRNGDKIKDYYEMKNLNRFMRSRGHEYGFEVGNGSVEEVESITSGERVGHRPQRFSPSGPVASQMCDIIDWALGYNFTTMYQFTLILEHFGIKATDRFANGARELSFQGTDASGDAVTGALTCDELPGDLASRIASSLDAGVRTHQLRQRERTRAENLVRSCFHYSHSQKHLENMLEKNGISMHVTHSDSGDVIGISFVDHVTKTAFKASQLHGVITASMIRQALETGKWRVHDRGEARDRSYVKESRQTAAALRQAMTSAAVNLGRGSGASGGSAGKDDDEDKRKAVNQAMVEANIAVRNVAVSNVATR